jgi:cytochrome c
MLLAGCGQKKEEAAAESEPAAEPEAAAEPSPNVLSDEEITEGWILLFDGESTNGWRNFKTDSIGSAWTVVDGTLHLDTSEKDGWQVKGGGDIITEDSYDNYELTLQWKIAEGANSGIIYHVQEDDQYDYVWQTGPEMQILDNERHSDGQIVKHRAGDLYDLIESSTEMAKEPGEWNTVRLISNNGKMEHWLNDEMIVSFDMTDDSWEELVAGSKFKEMPAFGKHINGHIALQDHGDPVWFRNIKIRPLASE